VIAAPDSYNASAPMENRTIGKLVELAANQFPYVVIDAGVGLGHGAGPVFQLASTIYLVTQVDIPSLRNSQRFLAYLRGQGEPRMELVVNRWRKGEFDDAELAKALGVAPKWKVPNDYAAARGAADTGTPLMN